MKPLKAEEYKPRKHIRVVEPPRELRQWYPGRWWRLEGPDGKLKAESSSEEEVRGFWEPGDTLYRIYEYSDKEFREEPHDGGTEH